MRRRPAALVFLCRQAKETLAMERQAKTRMPAVVEFDLMQILSCARWEAAATRKQGKPAVPPKE